MEQNRSYRSEATSDDSNSGTGSSSKKSPRYQGPAFQPVEQRSQGSSSFKHESVPRVPLEGLIPLGHRDRIVQEQLHAQKHDTDASSKDDDPDTETTAEKPTVTIPHSRRSEAPSAADHEQQRMHEMYTAEAENNEDDEENEEGDTGETVMQPSQATQKAPEQPRQEGMVPAEALASRPIAPAQAYTPHPDQRPAYQAPEHQERAFTPPQEGIPTLNIPAEYTPASASANQPAESSLRPQWQSEAASAFNDVAEYATDASTSATAYNQPPTPPPMRPPRETAGFAEPPDRPNYGPESYNPYLNPNNNSAEYQPPAAPRIVEQTRVVETQNRWVGPVLFAVVMYERYRRRTDDRKEKTARIAADKDLEKRLSTLSAIANRRHEDVLRASTTATENVRQLQTEQHQRVHEQQRLREVQERFGAQPLMYGSERVQTPTPFEHAPAPTAAKADAQPGPKPIAEMSPEEVLQYTQEQQERTRKVQSIWHETEVNAITGQEVEGIVHGKGYHEERQQEIMRDRTGDASTDPVAASMGSYAVQGQGVPVYSMQQQQGMLPSGMTAPTLPQGAPTHVDPQHQLQAGNDSSMKSNVTNPWFWLMLGLILAAFFTAALI